MHELVMANAENIPDKIAPRPHRPGQRLGDVVGCQDHPLGARAKTPCWFTWTHYCAKEPFKGLKS
jgi:hypothetical protein